MDLATVEIPRTEARQSYLDYRREAQRTNDPQAQRELEEIASAFRLAAKEDVGLIALTPAIERGGTVVRTLVHNRGRTDEKRSQYLLPRLAIAPADSRFTWCGGIEQDGRIRYCDRLSAPRNYRRGFFDLHTNLEQPKGFTSCGYYVDPGSWGREAWTAMVPIVPPKHRPARGLGKCAVLFEVEKWTWGRDPDAPIDPALLRHVGGDIYAVLATWDLTEIERLVLSGRRVEA